MKRNLIALIGFTFFMLFTQVNAQHSYLEDKYLGADDLIANGILYRAEHPNAKGNPFFPNDQWQPCTVYVKGKTFENLPGKLNLDKGKLLLTYTTPSGSKQIYNMNESLVDSFEIAGYTFIHKHLTKLVRSGSPFIEQIYRGNISLFLDHNKHYLARFNANTPHGAYSNLRTDRLLIKGGEIQLINKKKQLLQAFPDRKSDIKEFLQTHNIRYKQASRTQLQQILSFCDEL